MGCLEAPLLPWSTRPALPSPPTHPAHSLSAAAMAAGAGTGPCPSATESPPARLGPDGRTAAGHSVFAEGWIAAGEPADAPWGRPVGLLRLPDGSMLVGDDRAGVVYRIAFNETPPASGAAARRGSRGGRRLLLALLLAAAACALLC